MPPVLQSFIDQDSRVRYYACEALYNIAKVARGGIIPFFTDVFDALCKLSADSDPNVQVRDDWALRKLGRGLNTRGVRAQNAAHLLDRLVKDIVTESTSFSVEAFIPLLRERLAVLNPYVRQFLVGWITVLDGTPDIHMVEWLPHLLDGLLNMLSDPNREIRQQVRAENRRDRGAGQQADAVRVRDAGGHCTGRVLARSQVGVLRGLPPFDAHIGACRSVR